MTQSLILARHERRFGKGRHRKRRLQNGDDIWLGIIDRVLTILDEAEHDMRAMTKDYPPHILAEYLAGAAETRREIEAQRRDILLNPMPRAQKRVLLGRDDVVRVGLGLDMDLAAHRPQVQVLEQL